MKIAIIHEWLTTRAGSEKVLEGIIRLFPDADLFVVVDFLPESDRFLLQGKVPKVTFVQRLPLARSRFRHYLPLMPLAIEQLDLSSYELILSSHHAVAKGVITGPNQLHISYVHSPMRYAWDLQPQYLREAGLDRGLKGGITRYLLHRLRLWDQASANRVDHFVANSEFIKRRIWRCYRREATVIHPPVDVSRFNASTPREDFYLAASRLVPYKRIDLIVEAFSQTPHRRLIVIGDGPEMRKIRKLAGPNVTLLGYQPDQVLRDHLSRALAFVFAAEEDFGILPVEAQAAGAPVIAFGRGGALETVVDHSTRDATAPTGLFFTEQTTESLLQAIDRFESHQDDFKSHLIRAHAEKFSDSRFLQQYAQFVEEHIRRFREPLTPWEAHHVKP